LFASLNVATGEVIAKMTKQHRAKKFVSFLLKIQAFWERTLKVHGDS
jgi:hypothetical protein